jgi:nicotinamide/nicotinate riboside kinase
MSANTFQRVLLVGLSGPSSSGKTTIARLIREILPTTLILHEDDFYRPEEELPIRLGLRDWDCAEAIDLLAFRNALLYAKKRGGLPETLMSKEDQNEAGESGVAPETVAKLRDEMDSWAEEKGLQFNTAACNSDSAVKTRIIIVDGFLLFGDSMKDIPGLFDLRILLRATYEDAKRRREARSGYVTLEGFWADPPGYVDNIVWPGYVKEHASLFKDGDVNGELYSRKAVSLGLKVCPGVGTWTINQMLPWMLERLKESL